MATAGALPRQSRSAWGHFALTFPCPFPRQHSTQELIILGCPPCKCQTLAGETFGDAGGYHTEKPEMNRSARLDLRPSRGSQNTIPAAFRGAEDRPQPRLPCHPPSFSRGPFLNPTSLPRLFFQVSSYFLFSLSSHRKSSPRHLYIFHSGQYLRRHILLSSAACSERFRRTYRGHSWALDAQEVAALGPRRTGLRSWLGCIPSHDLV